MDLAKIIAEMKVELQCLDTAISSIEELARLQNALPPDGAPPTPPGGGPAGQATEAAAPARRPRGRPRKNPPTPGESSTSGDGDSSPEASDDGTASAA